LATRLSTISQLLNRDVIEVLSAWRDAAGTPLQSVSKAQLEDLLKTLKSTEDRARLINTRLWEEAINGNQDLSAELREIIGGDNRVLAQAGGAANDFVNAVSVYLSLHDQLTGRLSDNFMHAIRPNAVALQTAANNLLNWTRECNPRIAAKRRSLGQ